MDDPNFKIKRISFRQLYAFHVFRNTCVPEVEIGEGLLHIVYYHTGSAGTSTHGGIPYKGRELMKGSAQ